MLDVEKLKFICINDGYPIELRVGKYGVYYACKKCWDKTGFKCNARYNADSIETIKNNFIQMEAEGKLTDGLIGKSGKIEYEIRGMDDNFINVYIGGYYKNDDNF